jgi:type IX secretion system PorP/SprF family membrane protein
MKFKWLNIIIFVIAASFFFKNSILAQDVHFSQYFTTPLLVNPANTGVSGDDMRISNNYRNQWAKIDAPFNTFYFSLEKKLQVYHRQFGIGGSIIHDQSSSFNLTAEKFQLSLSYTRFYNNQQFVFGIQPGIVFKYYNSNGITFGSQFDPITGKFDPSLPSQENLLNDHMVYFDFNAGVLWQTLIKSMKPMAGFSIGHINRPTESFSASGSGSPLALKYTFHAQVEIPLNSRFDVTPCFLFGYTPGAREFVAGGIGGYSVNNFFIPVKKVYAINMYRINPVTNIDAIILGGGVKILSIDIGITYDINVSSLHNATNFQGAFEVSLVYSGGFKPKPTIEPCIIY